ncbi:hypothetical protein AMEX_G26635 [Astyanax mexicanus]|uniref:Uncharacterized LOC103038772 n=1 Tax=Astyanax mexicanus TaxID=7994 RepID=A0A8B9L0F1_ASTMX|nr:hypothetical protein AMEX_G26635 [Astyanax mexicanus]
MEEAYTALYQEFLRLQSLCLKQAAMLQHLTEALRRQQGNLEPPGTKEFFLPHQGYKSCVTRVLPHPKETSLPPLSYGDFEDLVSIPIQCTEEEATFTYPGVPAQAAQMPALAPHPGDANLAPLTGALHRLQLDPTWAEPKLNNCDQTMPVASPAPQASIVKNLQQVEQRWHSLQTSKPTRRPWSSSFMNSEMLSQAGGLLMSGVMVSSQVCEFCHAVFPGHTTTNGEFLRHLMSHT